MQLTPIESSTKLPCLASTAGVSVRERLAYWHDAIARNMLDLDFGLVGETPFEATFNGASVDALGISVIKASAHTVSRTEASIAKSDSDHILLNFVLAGRLVAEQDGRMAIINVGEAVACDARRTYSLRLDGPVELANVRLSRQSLTHAVAGMQRITAVNLNSSGPLCPLVFSYLNGLIGRAALLSETASHRISNSFIELIAGLLIDASQSSPAPLSDYRNLALIRIKDFVERNLGDVDLDPTMVAAALKLSPRYLNQLLELEGTSLSRYIWRRRLERAAADLRNSGLKGLSISTIALNNGFSNLSHFSKAFRDRFDHSPSEFRDRANFGSGH